MKLDSILNGLTLEKIDNNFIENTYTSKEILLIAKQLKDIVYFVEENCFLDELQKTEEEKLYFQLKYQETLKAVIIHIFFFEFLIFK